MFPETIDEALQQTILDWYGNREVCDDDKFETFFLRVLNKCIGRYNAILRVDPSHANYDWLVQRYLESQTKQSGGDSVTHSGALTTVHSGKDTTDTTFGHTIARTIEGEKTTEQTDTRRVHNDRENYRTGDFQTDTDGYVVNNQKTLAKQNPMSISYSGGVSEPTQTTGGHDAGGALDWTNPSSQAANFGQDTNHQTVRETRGHEFSNVETYVSAGGALTDTESYSADYEDKDTHGGKDTRETTHGETVTATDTRKAETDVDRTNRTRYTGRYQDPAMILKRAVSYIMTTDAWEWLYKQLDVCFMGIYDI